MMSITRRQVLAGAASAAVFSSPARAEPTTAAIIATAATVASLVIEMMKESGSEQKRWDAGFLLWHEIADGQRALLGAIERVDDKLNDVISLIRDVPAETVAMEYLSQIINSVRAVRFSPDPDDQHYKRARASFLSDAANIYGKARVTTVPRMAVAASQALAGINAIISIERLGAPSSDRLVREAIDKVEFACLSLLHPTSTLSQSITKFDAKIAEAQAALAADPLYAVLIPKLPSPILSVEGGGVRLDNQERCWVMSLPEVRGRIDTHHDALRRSTGTDTMYHKRTRYAGAPVEVFVNPVYGGDNYFSIAHKSMNEWRSGIWTQDVDHRVRYNVVNSSRESHVVTRSDDPQIIANCMGTDLQPDGYPVRLANLNSKLMSVADLVARKSVLLGLRDLTEANFRRCRQLKLMATE